MPDKRPSNSRCFASFVRGHSLNVRANPRKNSPKHASMWGCLLGTFMRLSRCFRGLRDCFAIPQARCAFINAKKFPEASLLWELYLRFLSPLNRDYLIIVATRPEPTVLPPSRSDLVVFRNLFVTVFAVL